jgi:hypothetical protein
MFKTLPSRTLVWVDPTTHVAEIQRCNWLIRIASNNPEPDSPEDCYDEVPCGLVVKSLDPGSVDPSSHTTCAWGHERAVYGSQRAWEIEMEAELADRQAVR